MHAYRALGKDGVVVVQLSFLNGIMLDFCFFSVVVWFILHGSSWHETVSTSSEKEASPRLSSNNAGRRDSAVNQ
jgi:hypothetical protein